MSLKPWHASSIAVIADVSVLMTSGAAQTRVLRTTDQCAKEALALDLFRSEPLQRELRKLEELYRQDPLAALPSGTATIRLAVDSIAMAAANYAANSDTDRPVVMWAFNAPHQWCNLDVMRSGYGVDNPDNVYRSIPIDGAARYEVRGKITQPGPAQQTFVLYSAIPGAAAMNSEGRMIEVAGFPGSDMKINDDGTFLITIDSGPANGRPNHLQSRANNHHMEFLARDTLNDWSTENVIALEVRRVGGSQFKPPPTKEQLEARAADILSTLGPYWLEWQNRVLQSKPTNEVMIPWRRAKGWGYTAYGNFSVAEDEALVVTVDALGAAYFAFQVANPWAVSLEYTHHNGSLTQAQVRPNPDGSFTIVLAPHDPGAYNWLDSQGLTTGKIQLRWQGVPDDVPSADHAVKSAQIAKLKDLKSVLPESMVFVTPEERAAQLKTRLASYMRRETE